MHEHAPVVRLLNEVGEHLFGHLEIGDHAVLHWLNGHYVARRAPEHVLGFLPDSHDLATVLIDGHNGWLVHHDAFALCVDQCVGRAQVNRKVGRKQAEDRAKAVSVLVHVPLSSGHFPRFADAAYRSASGWPLCVYLAGCLAYGTTISTRLMTVPPRRFCPVTAIEWLPRPNVCVKYLNVPSGCISATDSPLMISAAPGSVRPLISTTLPCNSVSPISSIISWPLPCAASVNLNVSLAALTCFCASVANTSQK